MTSEFTIAVHALVYLNHKAQLLSSEALAKKYLYQSCTGAKNHDKTEKKPDLYPQRKARQKAVTAC